MITLVALLVAACTGTTSDTTTSSASGITSSTSSVTSTTSTTSPPSSTTSTAAPTSTTAAGSASSVLLEVDVGAAAYLRGLAEDESGDPVVIYVARPTDGVVTGVSMVRCLDTRCEQLSQPTDLIPASPKVWGDVSSVLLEDGSPAVVDGLTIREGTDESDPGEYGSQIVVCSDPMCDGRSAWATSDSLMHLGRIGSGLAVVAELGEWDLALWACEQTDCSAPVVAPIGKRGPGMHGAAVFGPDGRPVIGYTGRGALNLVTCPSTGCDGTSIWKQWMEGTSLGLHAAPGLTSENHPLVVTVEGSDVVLVECVDPDCAATTSTRVGSGANGDVSPAVVAMENAVLVAWTSAQGVVVAHCISGECATSVLDGSEGAGGSVEIALREDGRPLIAFTKGNPPTSICLVECSAADCGARD